MIEQYRVVRLGEHSLEGDNEPTHLVHPDDSMRAHRIRLPDIYGKAKTPSEPLPLPCLSCRMLRHRGSHLPSWNFRARSRHRGYYVNSRRENGDFNVKSMGDDDPLVTKSLQGPAPNMTSL